MHSLQHQRHIPGRSAGLTLVEMMVTMLIGAFLLIGVISIFSQSRTAYRTNETVARMQENVRYALNTMQPDIRMARNWGMHNEPTRVTVPAGIIVRCPSGTIITGWALAPTQGVEASNGAYNLPCPAFGNAYKAGTDVLVVRHASGQPTTATNNVIQIQSNRVLSTVFNNGAVPFASNCPAPPAIRVACTYNWELNAYYVSSSSSLGPNVPSLRRKTLVSGVLQDQELITGVEDFQVELGIDTNAVGNTDNTVERYVNADNALVDVLNPASASYINGAKVLAVRMWLMFRAEQPEVGFVDGATYNYADVVNYAPGGQFRRELVNKTVLLRNSRG